MRFPIWPAFAIVLAACSKKEPAESERKEPWLAQAPSATPAVVAHYVVAERCSAELELKAKEATPRGTFRVCKGDIGVDLTDLSRTKGTLAVDLGSVEMLGEGDAGRSDELTQEAQNWLDIGASRPEAERERLRWATFRLSEIDGLSAESAHAGKLERGGPAADDAPAPSDGDAEAPVKSERRAVTFNARGSLLIHNVQIDAKLPLRVVFHYAGAATPDAKPARLTIESRHPLGVVLRTHDIKPRDASGVFQSQSMKLIGSRVGAEARVSLAISAIIQAP
ncbi:MAG: hypothetical protein U0263_36285 [Polyangiaceae bacterium]